MRAVFLDKLSLDKDDLDFSRLNATSDNWEFYQTTSKDEVEKRTEDAEIIVSNKVVLDKTAIENAKNLKLICVAATGTNNVDLDYAKAKGITVCNVRAYGTQSVVQHVFTLLLMLFRNIPQYQAAIKRGDWQRSKEFCLLDYPIEDLSGKIIGIVGYGELGQAVAKLAEAFGMEVRIADHTAKNEQDEKKTQSNRFALNQLLRDVDVLTLHCPLTEQTKNLIDEAELRLMKSSAYLVNMARGGIVNEHALKEALMQNRLAGAAIDVLETEPPQESSPLFDLDLPQLIITPHIAWASRSARQTLLNQVAENIEKYFSGTAQNIVV